MHKKPVKASARISLRRLLREMSVLQCARAFLKTSLKKAFSEGPYCPLRTNTLNKRSARKRSYVGHRKFYGGHRVREKVPHTQGSLPLEVVVQSSKFPSTTSKHRHGSQASKPVATSSMIGLFQDPLLIMKHQRLLTYSKKMDLFIWLPRNSLW